MEENVMLKLKQISESPFNPRSYFDEVALKELAADIEAHGVMQAITVRPKKVAGSAKVSDAFEAVFGHRRLRAAKLAGLEEIPCQVVELDDAQVIERQLSENLAREALAAVEVAEGYRALTKSHGVSVVDLAKRTGRSVAAIYAQMKLCDLVPAGKKAVAEGALQVSAAILIARIPNPKDQTDVLARVLNPHRPMNHREVLDLVSRDYMVDLRKALFDLKDTKLHGGACSSCPKRAGAQPDLFSEVKASDTCTDPGCFRTKTAAAYDAKAKALAAEGKKVLTTKQSAAIFKASEHPAYDSGYEAVSQPFYEDATQRSVKTLLGKSYKELVVTALTPSGNVIELVPKQGLTAAIDKAGVIKRHRHNSGPTLTPKQAKEKKEADEKRAVKEDVEELAVKQVIAKLSGRTPDKKLWRLMANALVDDAFDVLERRGLERDSSDKEQEKYFDSLDEAGLRGFVIEAALDRFFYNGWQPEYSPALAEACDLVKVDLNALEKQVKAARKEAADKKEATKKTKKAKGGALAQMAAASKEEAA